MKKWFLLLLVLSTMLFGVSMSYAATRVKGYAKKSGIYVAPHYRSNKNFTKFDNYSSKGNVNPFTGKKGTK